MFKVPYTVIKNIRTHPNADKLEIATIIGFDVVVQKDKYHCGDWVIYCPIDAIIPEWLETKIFPLGSKIKLHNHRIRQIRIRKVASQGMIISLDDVADCLGMDRVRRLGSYEHEEDLAVELGITKYTPPEPSLPAQNRVGLSRNKRDDHPLFHSYNGLTALKWQPDLFQENELVVVQEKLHGTNCRASMLPFVPDTLWKKIQKLLGINPTHEWNYGSNNVQISKRFYYKGFYGTDIYGEALSNCNAISKIKPNEIIYGEIIGPKIQANYTYGEAVPTFVLFDVKIYDEITQKFTWLSPLDVIDYARERGFNLVPILYYGAYEKNNIVKLSEGSSKYSPTQKVREGIVIKSQENYNDPLVHSGRRSLKLINESYLDDKSNTDNH